VRACLAVLTMLLVARVAGAQTEPLTVRFGGTWILNVDKSTMHPPAPQSERIRIEPSMADTIATKYTVTGTTYDGMPINIFFEGKIDGHAYPVMTNGQEIAQVTWRHSGHDQMSARQVATDGTVSTVTVTLSPDQSSFTLREHVSGKKGTYDITEEWDRLQ